MKPSDFSLIPTFVAIMEERSFSGAAKRLGVTQSAISQNAARLKILFDDPLFLRESHGISPSQLAHSLYPTLSTAVENIKLTTAEYRSFDPKSCDRQFRISALSVFGLSILPIISKLIREEAPLVSIKGEAHVAEEDTMNLLRNEYDLTLDVDYGQYHQLCSESVLQSELCVIARKDHPRIKNTHISSEDFLNERHVVHAIPNKKHAYLLYKGLSFDSILRQRNIAWYSNNIAEMLPIIEQNDYIGIFPKILINNHIAHSNLKTINCDFLPDTLHVSMFWHASRSSDPTHQWLRSMFSKAAKQLHTLKS